VISGSPEKSMRVLCVEDSELDYALILETLSREGVVISGQRVETEEDLRTALHAGQWDVVISDHQLPQLTAERALEIVQEESSDLPFIIVSGAIGEDIAVAAMRRGADDYLIKGRLKKLMVAVEHAIDAAKMRSLRKTALRNLELSEARLRGFSLHLSEVRERERAAVTREVHDDIAGNLLAARFALIRAERQIIADADSTQSLKGIAPDVHEATELLGSAIDSTQRLYTSLRHSLLDQGIAPAIEWRLTQLRKRSELQPHLSISPPDLELPEQLARALFSVATELIDNVALHAQAKNIWCTLFLIDQVLNLEIRDDGVGFRNEQLSNPDKFGVFSSRERLRPFDGTIDFYSVYEGDDSGTTVVVTIPLPPDESHSEGLS
jgi:signal transduction histidine kinase